MLPELKISLSKEEPIAIKLTKEEAIVLFEMFSVIEESYDTDTIATDDIPRISEIIKRNSAEEQILWEIHKQLQTTLVEPFDKEYIKILEKARETILKKS